ncbi:CLUMA_CG014340, isoform A [Clunio marinus]|uniref:CLUMA_CG014340, isoform A n=1 Tax=Clunio marinus TaxID=568069 RepID=A0A1J1IP22_9DIPT|nr:CLUMA_CG014340, isoform A [Clunio marinus]
MMEIDGLLNDCSSSDNCMEIDQYVVEWVHLTDNIWIDILGYLDVKSLLNASESCSRLNEIISSSSMLIDKINVAFKFPAMPTDRSLAKIDKLIENSSALTRRYRNLTIFRLRDNYLHHAHRTKSEFMEFNTRLSETIQNLKIVDCSVLRDDFVALLQPYVNLKECTFARIMFSDEIVPTDSYVNTLKCSNLKKLMLSRCDFFCLLLFKSHTNVNNFEMYSNYTDDENFLLENIESLKIYDPEYARPDVQEFENFLLKFKKLKELKMKNFRFNSTYSSDRLSSVPFQLEVLTLNNVKWDIFSFCEKFLKSQKNLKELKLIGLSEWVRSNDPQTLLSFTGILHHLLTKNLQLTSFQISTKYMKSTENIKDNEFNTEFVNNQMIDLTYIKCKDDKSDLLKIFTRLFPKIKKFRFECKELNSTQFKDIKVLKDLESLDITISPESLGNILFNFPALTTFKFMALSEKKSLEQLTQFFKFNNTIKSVWLNIEPLTFDEIIGMLMPLAYSLESLTISDLHLNVNEAQLFVSNFPHLRQLYSDLEPKQDALDVLSNASIIVKKVPTVNIIC